MERASIDTDMAKITYFAAEFDLFIQPRGNRFSASPPGAEGFSVTDSVPCRG
jgi:hypothetical protein